MDDLNLIADLANGYAGGCNFSLQRNRHMNEIALNEDVEQRHVDAILVDFINFIGIRHCCDYAMYTRDLKSVRVVEEDER